MLHDEPHELVQGILLDLGSKHLVSLRDIRPMSLREGDLPVLETTRAKFQVVGTDNAAKFVQSKTLGLAVAPKLVESTPRLLMKPTAKNFVHYQISQLFFLTRRAEEPVTSLVVEHRS